MAAIPAPAHVLGSLSTADRSRAYTALQNGGPLAVFDQPARDAIAQLDGVINGTGALSVWDTAISSEWTGRRSGCTAT